jgi:hypothetical protein
MNKERLFLQNKLEMVEDLMDNGLEDFMQNEGPNQIMNLMLEEHANNGMFGEIFDYNDFEDWRRCVRHDEKRKKFAPTIAMQVSKKFQLDTFQMLW